MGFPYGCKYICKHCGAKTQNVSSVCSLCNEKLKLIRRIKAMLLPYYEKNHITQKELKGKRKRM